MGVSGLVSRGSRAAVVGVSCSVGMQHGPVGSAITRAVRGIPLSARATARYGGNPGGPRDVDTVGVPGDWGYR